MGLPWLEALDGTLGWMNLMGPPGLEVVVSFLENFNQHIAANKPLLLVAAGCQWPESSGLGNVVDFWLTTLPMALPPKTFLHFSLN